MALIDGVGAIIILINFAVIAAFLYNTLHGATRYFLFARLAEDMATATIRSAAQGYRELQGAAANPYPDLLIAPLSGTPCLWFHYKVEKYVGGDNNDWEIVEQETSSRPLLLKDATGQCIIDPHGAEVSAINAPVWYGPNARPATPPPTTSAHWVVINRDSRYRYSESRIEDEENLYVIGEFRSYPTVPKHITDAGARHVITQWKSQQDTMLRAFDTDGDGTISQSEWENARRMATHIATKKMQPATDGDQVHVISSSNIKRHPFIISTKAELDMVSHYRRRMLLSLIAFIAALGFAASMLMKAGLLQ